MSKKKRESADATDTVQGVPLASLSLRARRVVRAILKRGFVTTADLAKMGYDHPPRAARDVIDSGIGLVKEMVTVSGRRMAKYSLGETKANQRSLRRRPIPKANRNLLLRQCSSKCALCGGQFQSEELQVDHRVPFHVGGDPPDMMRAEAFMLLCRSCQRAKSRGCEQCRNFEDREPSSCEGCYWATPESVRHVAMRQDIRILRAAFQGEKEVRTFDQFAATASVEGITAVDAIKRLITGS